MSWTYRELSNYEVGGREWPESPVMEKRLANDEIIEEEDVMRSMEHGLQRNILSNRSNDDEQVPLLTNIRRESLPNFSIHETMTTAFYSLPAVFLAVMLTLLDALSYGIIIFPHSDSHIPMTGPQAGISMFLVSTIISQLVFTFGGSAFKGAIGSMMIEVMPFLHIMCAIIEQQMQGAKEDSILATIMVSYACSTIMTGLVFLLIGYFKLGNMIQFFPRHILIGCIGGIGLFLLMTGVEITAKIAPVISFQYFIDLIQPGALKLWGSSFGIAMLLKLLQEFIQTPMLVPLFYSTIPILFYGIVLIIGVPMDTLRSAGWLFQFEAGIDAPFYIFWSYFDFGKVNWSAVASTIPTQVALTFFGILHVPINVPALSVSTRQDVDLSREIVAHGISNILSGLSGATQVYIFLTRTIWFIQIHYCIFDVEVIQLSVVLCWY
jgi:MFS superfamily sulfate permease-like transporter